jgi:hypothetical protein
MDLESDALVGDQSDESVVVVSRDELARRSRSSKVVALGENESNLPTNDGFFLGFDSLS